MGVESSYLSERANWPTALRVAAGLCDHLSLPAAVLWGPDLQLVRYNAGFLTLLGARRPADLTPLREIWPEIWPQLEATLAEVRHQGATVAFEDLMGTAPTAGDPVQRYFKASYAPILGDEDALLGMFMTGTELTRQIGEFRHLEGLLRLAGASSLALDRDTVAGLILAELTGALQADAAALYLLDAEGLLLINQAERQEGRPRFPIWIDNGELVDAVTAGQTMVVEAGHGNSPGAALLRAIGLGSGLILPLQGRRGHFGALISARLGAHRYQALERRKLEELVKQAGLALENALLYSDAQAALLRLQGLFSHAPFGIGIFDTSDNFVCLEHNPTFLDLLGADARERGSAVGLPLCDLFDDATFAAARVLLQHARTERRPVTIEEFSAVLPPDPSPRHYNGSIVPLIDAHGELTALLVSAAEVTSLVQARRNIEDLANQADARAGELEAVIAAIVDGVAVLDQAGRIVLLNETGRRLIGKMQGEPSVAARLERYAVRDPDTGLPVQPGESSIVRALAGETVVGRLTQIQAPDGGPDAWISTSATPLYRRDGSPRGAVAIFRDVSREKLAARQKDAFLAATSHELRTPLTGIKGMIQIARRRLARGETESLAMLLAHAEGQADRMGKLIDDLLEVGRIQGVQVPLQRVRADLAALLQAAVERQRVLSSAHRLDLVAPGEPVWALVDPLRLDQVLDNLLGNATKYMPLGGDVSVRLALEGREALITIRDRGIGVPEEGRDGLFERFYRATNASVQHFSGLGVGLWISRQLVERHGGRIWLESTGAEGSTFAVALPLA